MDQFCNVARLHQQIKRSLLDQPRENQLSVAHWLRLLNQRDRPALELLDKVDRGEIGFDEAARRLHGSSQSVSH